MKFKKIIAAGVASLALLTTSVNVVSAHAVGTLIVLDANMPAYNAKGKKIKKVRPFAKGDLYEILGAKKIKGKKFYRLTKKKYIIADDSKLIDDRTIPTEKPIEKPWESRHLVDTDKGGLVTQIKKALALEGEDRLEAEQEIAAQMNMNPKSVTSATQKGFEDRLRSYINSMDSTKNWIENGGK